MTANVYKKFLNVRLIHKILSLPLSFTALAVVYLLITIYGYREHGLQIFNAAWIKEPTRWVELRTFLRLAFGVEGVALVVLGVVLDQFAWPYFYRLKRAKMEYEIETEGSETGSDKTSEGGDARSA